MKYLTKGYGSKYYQFLQPHIYRKKYLNMNPISNNHIYPCKVNIIIYLRFSFSCGFSFMGILPMGGSGISGGSELPQPKMPIERPVQIPAIPKKTRIRLSCIIINRRDLELLFLGKFGWVRWCFPAFVPVDAP